LLRKMIHLFLDEIWCFMVQGNNYFWGGGGYLVYSVDPFSDTIAYVNQMKELRPLTIVPAILGSNRRQSYPILPLNQNMIPSATGNHIKGHPHLQMMFPFQIHEYERLPYLAFRCNFVVNVCECYHKFLHGIVDTGTLQLCRRARTIGKPARDSLSFLKMYRGHRHLGWNLVSGSCLS
jgi:hypothetical protein